MNKIELKEQYPITNREKEVYRTLRTNIEFSGVENSVIAITSCTPNDGKSTVSYYLASALAESGKKTLIIDADLRKSVFMQRYQVEGKLNGLSHFLSGQLAINEIIYATNKNKLYVLPSGVFPSNPTELLGNSRMKTLLSALKESFDYVIIDTPPLGSVIDAAVIAKNCDATVMVLASDVSSRASAKKVVAQLKAANPNFLGCVINKAQVKENKYYYRKYGGYYHRKYGDYYTY